MFKREGQWVWQFEMLVCNSTVCKNPVHHQNTNTELLK